VNLRRLVRSQHLVTQAASPLTSEHVQAGAVHQEDGSGGNTQKAPCKDASSLWVLRSLLACSSLARRLWVAHGADLIYSRSHHVWRARKCGHEGGHDKSQRSQRKALRCSIGPCIPETAFRMFYTGTPLLPPGVLIDAAKLLLCAQVPEHVGWPMAQAAPIL
jgi:hypothetical protein